MYLTASSVVHYLIGRGLIDPRTVVHEADLQVCELERHNRGLQVRREAHRSLYVKQIRVVDDHNIECLAREAELLRELQSELGHLLPQFIDYDPRRHAVVVELYPEAENLHQCYQRVGALPHGFAEQLGSAIGTIHAADPSTGSGGFLRGEAPWAFSVHNLGSDEHPSPANAEIVTLLRQHDDLLQLLDELGRDWSCHGLIHGDLKWNNILLVPEEQDVETVRCRIIDWEMARLGDPAWDVGTLLHSWWAWWIRSMPAEAPMLADDFVPALSSQLKPLREAMTGVWTGYCRTRGLESEQQAHLITTVLRYATARLVQTVWELLQHSETPSPPALRLLSLASQLASNPGLARQLSVGDPG